MLQSRFASYSKLASVFAFLAGLALFLPTSSAQLASKLRPRDFTANTMNYANVTQTMIDQTSLVAEVPINEKEVEVGDVDKDGDLDVVIVTARSFSYSGRRRNKLYLNNNGVLVESSHLVTGPPPGSPYGPFAGFADFDIARNGFLRDYDNDGWLDLIVISDDFAGLDVGRTRYYANKHPGGVFAGFEDETGRLNNANGAACGGFSGDFDHDGDDDIYFGNYPGPSQDTMWFNNGSGNYSITSGRVPADSDYCVDVAAGDINGDGKIDLLISNDRDPAFIYYNDLNGAGGRMGDFNYGGSKDQLLASAQGGYYPAMEPGDFNRDGKLDIYFANIGPNGRDVILVNTGDDTGDGKANFIEHTMPSIVSNTATAKVTVSDLNGDGRQDLIVGGGDIASQFTPARRTVIYRNTSVGGVTSFVEWSPYSAFPPGETESGWHAAAFDVDQDKRKDILVGGMNDDHLYKYIPTPTVKDSALGGSLPAIHNSDPLAIQGSIASGEPDTFTTTLPFGANSRVSAVLRSTAGLTLEVRNSGGTVIASSNRGGKGVEEAFEFSAPGGEIEFKVSLDQPTSTRGMDTYLLEVLIRTDN
jgi:hypothetical protein